MIILKSVLTCDYPECDNSHTMWDTAPGDSRTFATNQGWRTVRVKSKPLDLCPEHAEQPFPTIHA